ncbi:hypothetical protein ASPZODRAFT_453934 [Penicilliopsis zonata CBS 506.65]|uniref:Uncharacterized protein n=1 Tax=Penicilliopsis zonata CBS 506.65 TaxID=1073090 RepID=A0A1L9SX23_9EURO|nr:hypothetical protein ASPZODRAFT_453934 [Penicilliopsis zonata CBS 506.65]OJJ51706.1 hypothetical protein ASPZODRAFT_453934 [Penicilliopsis zonata CBS 506.65]
MQCYSVSTARGLSYVKIHCCWCSSFGTIVLSALSGCAIPAPVPPSCLDDMLDGGPVRNTVSNLIHN